MKAKARQQMREGYVLVVVVLMTIVGIAVASTIGFVSHAARQTRIYLARTRCRLAAQSAIEQAKYQIQEGFRLYAGGSGAASIKVDPYQADVYDWFDEVSGDHLTIGKGDKAVTLASPTNKLNGCKVYVAIGKYVDHANNSSVAKVPVVATGEYVFPDGLTVTATIQERVIFGTGQSKVFDYAYFVNNYGWMSGNTITINGDMRANGNVSLSQATVNGLVYAAANDELGVSGTVTLNSSPQIKNTSAYRSAAGNRARPDKKDYDTSKAFDAPASSGTIRAPTYDADGNILTGTVGESSGDPIVNAESDSLPMPFVSELDNYVKYAQTYKNNRGGTLSYPEVTYTDSAGETKTVAGGSFNSHYTGSGPSGVSTNADNGALLLVGTVANPIVIDGPVVVDSDVIIKGYVKGKGTIYSGRNVHIIGDVKYVDAPNWGHVDADDAAVDASNKTKDMLGLVAKGNIVLGDYTYSSSSSSYYGYSSDSWHNSVDKYIKSGTSASVVHSYACDASDANIGYPSTFAGDYTAVEKVTDLTAQQSSSAPGGYDSASGQFGKLRSTTVTLDTTHEEAYYDRWGRYQGTKTVNDTKTELKTSFDRRYYETVCDDAVLKSLAESGISQVDAIMYNNHGTFGTLGKNGSYVNINGSLVCRDEALIYTASGLRFNWDFRLRSDDTDGDGTLGLPVGPQDPYTYDWLQVPDSLNPAYAAKGGTP